MFDWKTIGRCLGYLDSVVVYSAGPKRYGSGTKPTGWFDYKISGDYCFDAIYATSGSGGLSYGGWGTLNNMIDIITYGDRNE
jgi:hypothetical protein